MELNLVALVLLVISLDLVIAKPVQESCSFDQAGVFVAVDPLKFSGKWYIYQHGHREGKWVNAYMTVEDATIKFYDYTDAMKASGTFHFNKDNGFLLTVENRTSVTGVLYFDADYQASVLYERLKVDNVAEGRTYLLTRQPEVDQDTKKMASAVNKGASKLCLKDPQAQAVEAITKEVSGDVQRKMEHSGDVGSGEEDGTRVEGSGYADGSGHVEGSGDVTGSVQVDGSGHVDGSGRLEGSGESDKSEGSGEHICPNVICAMHCTYGFEKDEHGCNICKCVTETCALVRDAVNENVRKSLGAGSPLLGAEPPVCEKDGSYSAKQCSGSKCYCVNSKGKTIPEFLDIDRWHANSLTCGCAREYFTQTSLGKEKPSVRCDTVGNYHPVQCYDRVCYCVDPSSGAPVEGSQVPLAGKESLEEKCATKDMSEKKTESSEASKSEKETKDPQVFDIAEKIVSASRDVANTPKLFK